MIFYFSATGNCKHVAERIAGDDRIISIADCVKNHAFSFTLAADEALGFVCPTYFWGLPSIARDFLKELRLTGNGRHYTYFVATYGTTTGNIIGMAHAYLKKKGFPLDARFSVKMPDTWTPMFDLSDTEKVAAINAAAENEIAVIARQLANRDTGDFIKAKVPALAANVFHPTYDRVRKTKHLSVEASCIGCGLCAKKCPVQAITMIDGKPVWTKKQCTMCLGCLHRCPKYAIQYGKNTRKHGQYQNPYTVI